MADLTPNSVPPTPEASAPPPEAAALRTEVKAASGPDTAASVSSQIRPHIDRRIAAVVVAVVVVIGLLVALLPRISNSGSPSGETIWQKITDGISADGTVPKQTALEAFAYVFKTNVPGVTIPNGVNGSDVPTSSTGVMRWVQANWDALTPDQQSVVNRYLAPQAGPHYTPGETLAEPISSGIELAAYHAPTTDQYASLGGLVSPIDLTIAPDAPADLALAMAFDVASTIAHIGPKLGMDPIPLGGALFPDVTLTLSDTDGGNGLFLTRAVEGTYQPYTPCNITAWKNLWSTQTVNGDSVSPVLHDLITHEVVHCYQNVVWGSVDTSMLIPSFITEGTAIYLAADDTGVAEPMIPSMWKDGYLKPETPLTERSYDAFGYYALLAHEGRDLWGLMKSAWQAAATGSSRSNAFIAVLKGDDSDIRDNWAESYVDSNDWGDPWILYGLGAPHPANTAQHKVAATLSGTNGSLLSRANTLLKVNATEGEVVVIDTDGLASVHDDNGHSSIAFQDEKFCTAESGCKCPDGTLLAGEDMAPNQLSIPFTAAMNAPLGGSKYTITAYKLDDLCQKKATPPPTVQPSPNPCGASCPGSNGDPHMLTVNNYRYDFQAAAEFTLLRSTDDSVDIQARQEPYHDLKTISINTAVAAKVGNHKVGVYVTDSGLQAHVDGQVADFSSGPIDLGDGGSIFAVNNGIEVDFPDGTKLWALSVGVWGINAQIHPSASLAADGQGLLGKIVPGGLGVPLLPDGTRLPAATDSHSRFETVYGQFADAWRVTDSTSLFDYDPGKSTATYTIKPYPDESGPQSVSDLTADQQAAGNSACTSITDQGLHDDCVFDVAVTGEQGFAQGYIEVQHFYDSGISPVPTPTSTPEPSSPAVTPAPGNVNEGWKLTQVESINQNGGYALGDDDTIYVSAQTGDNTYSLLKLDPVNQKILAQVSVPAETPIHYVAGSVWLPGLKTDANGNTCSVTRFDGQTLAEQATIALPCDPFGTPKIATDGSALWFEDDTKYDLGTSTGTVMRELDTTTNAPTDTTVAIPGINGAFLDSDGAIFWLDNEIYYRYVTGATSLETFDLPASSVARAAGTGLWTEDSGGGSASYYASPSGTPQVTVKLGDAFFTTGDENAAYGDEPGYDSQGNYVSNLWRYPIDGSTPTQLATGPLVDGQGEDYSSDPQPLANGDGVFKFWNVRPTESQPFALLQWVPVQ